MDPNKTLERLREYMQNFRAMWRKDGGEVDILNEMPDMVALFETLDEWLCRGGALPTVWTPRRAPSSPAVPASTR